MIYVKNKELKRALAESKEKGQLTRETIEMFTLIVNGMSKTHSYRDYEDREYCICSGIEDLLKYGNRYEAEKADNAFAFISQIAHNGMKKGWKKIHPPKSIKTIPFSRIVKEDNSNYNV